MRRTKLLLTGALVAVLAACGLEPASQSVPDVQGGPELAEFDNLGEAPIVTTSKDFTEQLILGKMLSLVLKAKGADVADHTNTKGSVNARETILNGSSDIAWEYTGTAWLVYMGHSDVDPKTSEAGGVKISDPEALYEAVKKADLKDNDVVWGDPAPFNNTYAMAIKEDQAKQKDANGKTIDVKSLSDLAKLPPDKQTYCLENEFENRPDGWPGMQQAYDIDVPKDNVTIMDTGVIYSRIGGGSCLAGEVFDTDGRIPANGLRTLEDDKGYFPIYEPAVTIREEIHKKHPQIVQMFNKLGSKLSTETMRRLNAEVDVDGRDPLDVAREWLVDEGFLKN
ncbi:glycine betaine ABC transporter substrate-binding protein [Stackebrandtia nassauensis]|uniref:Substrate-binding region of ABC-type glycine betaine transport system n=1 Tax=Stackebrandtia nassauensis (strain DSM 44728 / CIP 108903 / NRRL B-16338 / NBRC 102104 / LLR-40K-21) TaxID=446470 RepID=D3QBS4_STANL|nr:glycine betaine ABC transporter substrate-binding protein [Stackebrandtia nassauensis]ADD44813.1 Substrate-binding region of ABC-type glycine betaine transport system [Stackebrandtia nassauensis DSM 44728]